MTKIELTPLQEKELSDELENAYLQGGKHGKIIESKYILTLYTKDTEYRWGNNYPYNVICETYNQINYQVIAQYIQLRRRFISGCTDNLFSRRYFEQILITDAYLTGQKAGLNGYNGSNENIDDDEVDPADIYPEYSEKRYATKKILYITGLLVHPKMWPEENEKFKM